MKEGLGTYSVESGLIYFDSSLLYAAEAYHNITEYEFRLIESKEEECLKKLIETGRKCSGAMIYLEFGILSARFQIQIMMLNFLHDILLQEKHSLMFRFFQPQLCSPIRGDWITNSKKILRNIVLNKNINLKKNIFLRHVR